jgi:hypothetical protein
LPARISFANFGEPVTFARSPILMKFVSGVSVSASLPLSRRNGSAVGTARGEMPRTAAAIFSMCGGVVPQQPPTMLNMPARAHSQAAARVIPASQGKPVGSSGFGSPAFG